MTDRTVLADALALADVATLKEDAQEAMIDAELFPETAPSMLRLAALALAVAQMQDKFVEVYRPTPVSGWQAVAHNADDWAEGATLPAALAQLLRGAP